MSLIESVDDIPRVFFKVFFNVTSNRIVALDPFENMYKGNAWHAKSYHEFNKIVKTSLFCKQYSLYFSGKEYMIISKLAIFM